MKINIIITGATGLVGEGVLLECLAHPEVRQVLMINRKPSSPGKRQNRECAYETPL